MKNKRNKKIKYFLIIIMLAVVLGYAIMYANLSINGISRISGSDWDIHFENLVATDKSNVVPTYVSNASPEKRVQSITYDINFNQLGQVYEFTVDVVNKGIVDAIMDNFVSKIKIDDGEEITINDDNSNLPSYLNYSIKNADDSQIVLNHSLASGQRETIKVRLELCSNLTDEVLAEASGKTIKLSFNLNYKQLDDAPDSPNTNNIEENIVYEVSQTKTKIGTSIPNDISLRTGNNGPTLAMADWSNLNGITNDSRNIFLKHELDSSKKISESYIGIYISNDLANEISGDSSNNGYFYLKGGDSAAFSENLNNIRTMFNYDKNYDKDPTRCYYSGNNNESYICAMNTNSTGSIWISFSIYGYLYVGFDKTNCYIDTAGNSKCEWTGSN